MAAKPIYAAGLDAGSRNTRLVVLAVEDGCLRFLGGASVASQGWVKGMIADQGAVAASILDALREAEAAAGVSIESVVVGVGGPGVRGANGRGVMDWGHPREIEQRDINRAVDRAMRVQLPEDRMLLQLFPQDFVVDDSPGHTDPHKMVASRLEINVHLLTASTQEHTSLVGAVNQAHLAVDETVFEAMASCYAAVLPENRGEGIAVVDIGAQSTELVVYYGDTIYLASAVRVCGDHFTRDLAQGLCLSFEDAEQVKIEFGGARAESVGERVLVELPTPENREPREAASRHVNRILQARAEELFRHVRAEVARAGMDGSLMGGVFLTGGGAKLPELCDVAETILNCQIRYGWALGIEDWPSEMKDPEWATVAGLAMYSARLKAQTQRQREAAGWLAKVMR